MTDRYVLVRDDSNAAKPLELMVDRYVSGRRAAAGDQPLGRRSFIVSLALALGLSRCRRRRVDSLFIDEGFASLDEDYMEAALQTRFCPTPGRPRGQAGGRDIHVEELKERIDVQIE